jgi:hypothetical protein
MPLGSQSIGISAKTDGNQSPAQTYINSIDDLNMDTDRSQDSQGDIQYLNDSQRDA